MHKNKIVSFNLLRIVVALIVFLFHLRLYTGFGISWIKGFDTFIGIGNVVMVGFFILSGFVLYYNYYDKDLFKFSELKKYYFKRIISIYPLYILIF